jgi:hypothetical protein
VQLDVATLERLRAVVECAGHSEPEVVGVSGLAGVGDIEA